MNETHINQVIKEIEVNLPNFSLKTFGVYGGTKADKTRIITDPGINLGSSIVSIVRGESNEVNRAALMIMWRS